MNLYVYRIVFDLREWNMVFNKFDFFCFINWDLLMFFGMFNIKKLLYIYINGSVLNDIIN